MATTGRRALVTAFMAVGIALFAGAPATAQDDPDCEDYTYQEEAQAALAADPSDPYGLDDGGVPGLACESLPSLSATDAAVPTGGVATGFGGLADSDSSSGPPLGLVVGASSAALLALGGVVLVRRRSSQSRLAPAPLPVADRPRG